MFPFSLQKYARCVLSIAKLVSLSAFALSHSFSFSQSLKSDAALFNQPGGAKVGIIKSSVSINVMKRWGFWAQIQSVGGNGWARLSDLSFVGISAVTNLATGRTGSDNVVSTSAARGLSAKDLLNGRPDSAAVSRMDAWVSGSSVLEKFISDGGAVSVDLTSGLRVILVSKSASK
jgi:hypothetical protein